MLASSASNNIRIGISTTQMEMAKQFIRVLLSKLGPRTLTPEPSPPTFLPTLTPQTHPAPTNTQKARMYAAGELWVQAVMAALPRLDAGDIKSGEMLRGTCLGALKAVVLQVAGHGQTQLVAVLQQQLLLLLPRHLILHELIACTAQTCISRRNKHSVILCG